MRNCGVIKIIIIIIHVHLAVSHLVPIKLLKESLNE